MAAPVFVVGFQRSGTTLLQALLGAHPTFAAPPETHFIFRIARLADYYGDLADDAKLRRALHDSLNPPAKLLDGCGFDEEVLLDRLRAGPRTYAALLDAILSDFAARHGKQRWCEKTPSQPADGVYGLFPDAQVVHIVRDPRDVAASALKTPWQHSRAYRVARAWRTFTLSNVRRGLAAGPSQFLQIRYEDLTRSPTATLQAVCAFLGEEFDPAMVTDVGARRATVTAAAAFPWQSRVLENIEPAIEGRWRGELTRRQRLEVNAVVWAEVGALGYEPARPAVVAAGLALTAVPRAADHLATRVRRTRLRHAALDPVWRYTETQRFIRQQAELVG